MSIHFWRSFRDGKVSLLDDPLLKLSKALILVWHRKPATPSTYNNEIPGLRALFIGHEFGSFAVCSRHDAVVLQEANEAVISMKPQPALFQRSLRFQ